MRTHLHYLSQLHLSELRQSFLHPSAPPLRSPKVALGRESCTPHLALCLCTCKTEVLASWVSPPSPSISLQTQRSPAKNMVLWWCNQRWGRSRVIQCNFVIASFDFSSSDNKLGGVGKHGMLHWKMCVQVYDFKV